MVVVVVRERRFLVVEWASASLLVMNFWAGVR
jgi:hypothetical protein